jgi:hypothetical protein
MDKPVEQKDNLPGCFAIIIKVTPSSCGRLPWSIVPQVG